MSEKRKASAVIMLRYPGKRTWKVELFDAWKCWPKHYPRGRYAGLYRLRVNGKWFKRTYEPKDRYTFVTWYEFRDLLWKSAPNPRDARRRRVTNDAQRPSQ